MTDWLERILRAKAKAQAQEENLREWAECHCPLQAPYCRAIGLPAGALLGREPYYEDLRNTTLHARRNGCDDGFIAWELISLYERIWRGTVVR